MLRKLLLLPVLVITVAADAADAAAGNTLLAVFAHPDDESTVAPLLSRYAREGALVHLVIATDGRYGVTDFSGFEEGDALAEERAAEMRCSAQALGVKLTHLDYHDQLKAAEGYDGHIPHVRAMLRDIAAIVEEAQPDAIITWGPDGGSNHMDHRLVGATVTGVYLGKDRGDAMSLYFYGTPAGQIEDESERLLRGVDERYVTTGITYEAQDLERAAKSMRCHRTQWTEAYVQRRVAEMERSGRTIWLRRFEPPRGKGDSLFLK